MRRVTALAVVSVVWLACPAPQPGPTDGGGGGGATGGAGATGGGGAATGGGGTALGVGVPLVFVSRQIHPDGSFYWDSAKDMAGVGAHR